MDGWMDGFSASAGLCRMVGVEVKVKRFAALDKEKTWRRDPVNLQCDRIASELNSS